MTDEPALIAAILADREDDTARLVYADWCDENGQPERAEFVRVQVALARLEVTIPNPFSVVGLLYTNIATYDEPLWVRLDDLSKARGLQLRIHELWDIGTHGGGFLEIPGHWGQPYWRRGFIESTRLPWSDWLAHADAILAAHPVERVKLTTWPVFDVTFQGEAFEYNAGDARIAGKTIRFPDTNNGIVPVKGLLETRWPGIVFDLPPEPTLPLDGWTIELDQSDPQTFMGRPVVMASRLTREVEGWITNPPLREFGPVVATDAQGRTWTCQAMLDRMIDNGDRVSLVAVSVGEIRRAPDFTLRGGENMRSAYRVLYGNPSVGRPRGIIDANELRPGV